MPKNEIKAKSTRKPPREVSNGLWSSKSVKKKAPQKDDKVEDDALDRLLLVRSDLSSLIHQIDELVMKALKVNVTTKKNSKEIDSFIQVLSEIQSSLKPWAPRIKKALSSHSIGSENQLGQDLVSKTVTPETEEKTKAVRSPEQTKLDSLVSPSPLVSWRANCTAEGGRQLFLLTPMPRPKAFSSKLEASSKSAFLGPPSLVAITMDTNDDDLLEDVAKKPTPSKVPDFITKRESTLESGFVSPSKFSTKDCSVLVMTPCLKMSPPKSCVLLEPISELSHKGYCGARKSTPFPVGIPDCSGSQISESSSSEVSENLGLRYPELFGIQPSHKLGIGRKGVEASPDWLTSPPKYFGLLELPNEQSAINDTGNYQLPKSSCVQNQQTYSSLVKRNDLQSDYHPLTRKSGIQELGGSSVQIESTPVWKEPESTFRTGKRPGENTLKKELWTRFDAATSHGVRVITDLQETAQKGFLDRLDEVCCDDSI